MHCLYDNLEKLFVPLDEIGIIHPSLKEPCCRALIYRYWPISVLTSLVCSYYVWEWKPPVKYRWTGDISVENVVMDL